MQEAREKAIEEDDDWLEAPYFNSLEEDGEEDGKVVTGGQKNREKIDLDEDARSQTNDDDVIEEGQNFDPLATTDSSVEDSSLSVIRVPPPLDWDEIGRGWVPPHEMGPRVESVLNDEEMEMVEMRLGLSLE